MSVRDTGDSYIARFDSWGDFLDFSSSAPLTYKGSNPHSRHTGYYARFCMTKDFPEAMNLAVNGWTEGASKIRGSFLKDFSLVSELVEREHYSYDVEGMDFDVARYLEGEPEVWVTQEKRIAAGTGRRILRMVVNNSSSAGVTGEAILNRGGAICALISALELGGHGVELILADGIRGNRGATGELYVKIKSADSPLDLDRVAFAIAHPSTLRRLMFSAQERLPHPGTFGVGAGYGQPAAVTDQGDIYFSHAYMHDMDWNNPTQVKTWLLDTLKKYGVQIKETEEK